MIAHNLKFSFRSMQKNSLFTFLNITGFAVGFAVSFILALFIYRESTVDRCFKNHENIYRIIDAKKNSTFLDYDLAQVIKNQYPDVKYAAPLKYLSFSTPSYISRHNAKDFIQIKQVISTTNNFFSIFSIKTITSKTDVPFADKFSLVLTRSTANKLFGRTDVLGELVNFGDVNELPVSAIVEDFPENSSLGADIFLNSENEQFRFSQYCNDGGCYNPLDLYVSLNTANVHELEKRMNLKFPVNKSKTDSVMFQPVSEIYLTPDIRENNNKAGSKGLIMIFLTITFLILILSVINYVNFSLSKQLSMLKEIGIKLTNGAGINQLRLYYVTEVVLFVFISIILALGITWLSLPYTEKLFDATLKFEWLFHPPLSILFVLLFLAIILITSFAPVYIITRFDVQKLFGKKGTYLGKQTGKKVLTVFQMVASVVLIVCFMVIQKQLNYVKTIDLGFEKELLLKMEFPRNFKSAEVMKQQIDRYSFVKSSSLSHGGPGAIRIGMGTNLENAENFYLDCICADENFLKTMNIKLIVGREFLRSDFNNSCYINKAALKRYGWSNIENRKFNNGREGGYNIVGVVEDFHITSLHNKIDPVSIIFGDWNGSYSMLNIRLNPGNIKDQMGIIKDIWQKMIPGSPFNFTFYDTYFNSLYQKEERQAKAITLFSILTLIITSLGLLGQIFQACITKIKEIGIRKVNGARILEVMAMLNKDFIVWGTMAYMIACPIAWYAMHKWLQNFAYQTALSWWIFALTGVIVLVVVLLVVSWQTWRAASRNPVESLRYE